MSNEKKFIDREEEVNYSWIESTELATIRKYRRFLKLLPSDITAVMSHRGVIDRTLYEGNMFLHNCVGVGRKGPFRVGKKGPFLDGKKGPYEGNPGLYMVV